jgi:hypothetical protein
MLTYADDKYIEGIYAEHLSDVPQPQTGVGGHTSAYVSVYAEHLSDVPQPQTGVGGHTSAYVCIRQRIC